MERGSLSRVRNDEAEHMKTMQFCQLPGTILRAPSEAAACSVVFNNNVVRGKAVEGGGAVGDDTAAGAAAGGDRGEPRYTSECVDDYSGVMDRTCEGLIDCVFNPEKQYENPS